MEYIGPALDLIVLLVTFAVGAYILHRIKPADRNKRIQNAYDYLDTLRTYAQTFVEAADQIEEFRAVDNAEKMHYVLDRLQQFFPDEDVSTLRGVAESAVHWLRKRKHDGI